jgi:kinesin family protein C1
MCSRQSCPRDAQSLFLLRSQRLRVQGWSYSMQGSCIEIYNDRLRDLLAEGKHELVISDINAIKHESAGECVPAALAFTLKTCQNTVCACPT